MNSRSPFPALDGSVESAGSVAPGFGQDGRPRSVSTGLVANVPGAGMVVWCAWCGALLGLREPFEDWSTMLAVCVGCAQDYGPRLPDDHCPRRGPPGGPEPTAEQESG